jgi:hypothetical protein
MELNSRTTSSVHNSTAEDAKSNDVKCLEFEILSSLPFTLSSLAEEMATPRLRRIEWLFLFTSCSEYHIFHNPTEGVFFKFLPRFDVPWPKVYKRIQETL